MQGRRATSEPVPIGVCDAMHLAVRCATRLVHFDRWLVSLMSCTLHPAQQLLCSAAHDLLPQPAHLLLTLSTLLTSPSSSRVLLRY